MSSISSPSKAITERFEKQRIEMDELRSEIQSLKSLKSSNSTTDLSTVQSQIYQIQESIEEKLEVHSRHNKLISEESDKLKAEMEVLRMKIITLKSTEESSDFSKFEGKLYQMQESVNQKIANTNKEIKNLSEIANQLKMEMSGVRKGKINKDIHDL